jgi:NAD(P)-dependent dehydrogenase (short-subunit alcohol dehydrogenase family)
LLLSLKGKVAVVTGSTIGIDFAISKEFAENNDATVIVCSRSKQSAVKSAEEIKGKTFAAEIDVTNSSSIKRFLQQIVSDHERIDILINNAGYPFDRKIWYKKFHKVTDDEVDRIIEVDLKGSVRLSMAVLHSMLQNNPEEWVIINISSTPAIAGHIEGASYTIAKAANIALTKCILLEYGGKNIRAYTLALDNIATLAKYYSMNENDRNKAAEEPSMRRWGRPEEVAKVAACIASDNFSFATGNTIVIDGGTVLL